MIGSPSWEKKERWREKEGGGKEGGEERLQEREKREGRGRGKERERLGNSLCCRVSNDASSGPSRSMKARWLHDI